MPHGFLEFFSRARSPLSWFSSQTKAEATDLSRNGHVVGGRVTTSKGQREVRANLIVGADGRHSVIANVPLAAVNLGAPMDVMWMRLTRRAQRPGTWATSIADD